MNLHPGVALLIVVGWVILFLVLREFFCWYWKINKVISLLESIDTNLKKKNRILFNEKSDTGKSTKGLF